MLSTPQTLLLARKSLLAQVPGEMHTPPQLRAHERMLTVPLDRQTPPIILGQWMIPRLARKKAVRTPLPPRTLKTCDAPPLPGLLLKARQMIPLLQQHLCAPLHAAGRFPLRCRWAAHPLQIGPLPLIGGKEKLLLIKVILGPLDRIRGIGTRWDLVVVRMWLWLKPRNSFSEVRKNSKTYFKNSSFPRPTPVHTCPPPIPLQRTHRCTAYAL